MDIEIKDNSDMLSTFILKGEFDIYNTVIFKKQINERIEKGTRYIICDLTRVSYIDSSGIGSLMVCLSSLKKVEGRFMLVGVKDAVKKVFEITKMISFFEIYDMVSEATASIETI